MASSVSSWAQCGGGRKDSARRAVGTPSRDSITELIVPAARRCAERPCDNRRRRKCHIAREKGIAIAELSDPGGVCAHASIKRMSISR
ncbi:hypothetical protein NX784_16195 [Massilia pinisoli]|uniref:Uncharacterized protein n=1 Tax=Massilia pinisoli TaxID=1772194 RepID=A0ABT1ZT93_9BURK|nr:hypothetical protein [Massilia pinisoli]MCS0583131.1 hypothetical protein [Massilia pinisoli]